MKLADNIFLLIFILIALFFRNLEALVLVGTKFTILKFISTFYKNTLG